MTGQVILQGLEFHAYHGVYAHERSSGNKFEVDLIIETEFGDAAFQDDLSGTISYEEVYTLVKAEMEKPSKLLERVGYLIAEKIMDSFPNAISIEISISKFNPPIGGVCRKASVTIKKVRIIA